MLQQLQLLPPLLLLAHPRELVLPLLLLNMTLQFLVVVLLPAAGPAAASECGNSFCYCWHKCCSCCRSFQRKCCIYMCCDYVDLVYSAEEPHLKDEIREAGGIEVLVKLLASKVCLHISYRKGRTFCCSSGNTYTYAYHSIV